VTLIFVIAFLEGREVTFWPPRVGVKPNKTEKGNRKETKDKNDGDSNQELAVRIASVEREIVDLRARFAFEDQIIAELPRGVAKKISDLFSIRDSAVSESNRRKFLETQLGEKDIAGGNSIGYINTSKLTTSILRLIPIKSKINESTDIDYVVFVREDYEHKNKYTHSGYLAYYITTTEEGPKIAALKTIIE
jgi:hypothetical protein